MVGQPAGDIGDLPTAFVVRQPGATVSPQQLIDYVSKEVSFIFQFFLIQPVSAQIGYFTWTGNVHLLTEGGIYNLLANFNVPLIGQNPHFG